jgi:transcriptional regulator with XRE-family HTH domain
MAFKETFTDLRKRRRIPMRLFEERASINRSYIYGIEKEDLLPSREKLEALTAVFVSVAEEQGAADPGEDARLLSRERDRTLFVERLGFDEAFAESLLGVRELDDDQRADLVAPLEDSLKLFRMLTAQERHGLAELMHGTVGLIAPLDGSERARLASAVARAVVRVQVEYAQGTLPDDDVEWLAELSKLRSS